VIFGRGYGPQQVEELKNKCAGIAKEPIAWVRGDPAQLPTGAAGPDYVRKISTDMKNVVTKWVEEGGKDVEILVY
jgi:hypothetical protein